MTEGYFRETSHNKQKIPQEPLHRLTLVPLVLSGPLCPAGISPPRGESPLSGEAIKQCPHSPKWKISPTALWKRSAASIRHSFQHCGKPFRRTAEAFSTKNPPKRKTCGKCFFAKNSRFRRSAGADSKKPPVFVENALRFLWNTLKMKSIFCTILLKNAYLSLHFASFRV